MFSKDALHSPDLIAIANAYQRGEGLSIQTSGSTGSPTLFHFTHEQLKQSALRTIRFFGLTQDTKALLCLSPKTIGGAMMIVRAIEANYALQTIEPHSNPLENQVGKLDFVAMAPLQLAKSLEKETAKLKGIQHVLIGGGSISESTVEELKRLQLTVWQSYGMTETCSHVALRKVGYREEQAYQALPGILFTEDQGRLGIQMNDNTLWTNDLVELHTPQSFTWMGRADFTINTGGVKVQIEDLETSISKLVDVEFCIWKEEDATFGEKIVMLCTQTFELEKQLMQKHLHRFHLPKTFYLVNKIEKSALGKILRKQTFDNQIIRSFEALL